MVGQGWSVRWCAAIALRVGEPPGPHGAPAAGGALPKGAEDKGEVAGHDQEAQGGAAWPESGQQREVQQEEGVGFHGVVVPVLVAGEVWSEKPPPDEVTEMEEKWVKLYSAGFWQSSSQREEGPESLFFLSTA